MQMLHKFFGNNIISQNVWPPQSPDLTPLDFCLCGGLKDMCTKTTHTHWKNWNKIFNCTIQAVGCNNMRKTVNAEHGGPALDITPCDFSALFFFWQRNDIHKNQVQIFYYPIKGVGGGKRVKHCNSLCWSSFFLWVWGERHRKILLEPEIKDHLFLKEILPTILKLFLYFEILM